MTNFQATSAFTYWFEISTAGYTGQLPNKIFIDLTFQINAYVSVTGRSDVGGSSQAIAMVNVPGLTFYSQAVQACGNTGQGGISCFLNEGQPAGVLITYEGISTLNPFVTNYIGTQVLKVKRQQFDTWFEVDLSAFCNSQGSYPSLGGSRTCNASADPVISFDASNGILPSQIQILESANIPPAVPEPGTWVLLASGAAGLGVFRRFRR